MGVKFRALCFFIAINSLTFAFSSSSDFLLQGYEAYSSHDWQSAVFFLRKAFSDSENSDELTLYMLIMSEMYLENYSVVVTDSDLFFSKFPESKIRGQVAYQKGKALHFLEQNDSAVILLSDFCHEFPESDMYSSALFWIAECFYDDFNYEMARSLYERILEEFPKSSKASEAQFKLNLIMQREREQKLLYLLKMTGEEYLDSREKYERQIKTYQTESSAELRKELAVANERIAELEKDAITRNEILSENEQLKKQIEVALKNTEVQIEKGPADEDEILLLKKRARMLLKELDENGYSEFYMGEEK